MGEWTHGSTFFRPRYELEVSGQLHATAVLPPGKEHPVPIGQEVGWTPETVWTIWRIFLNLPGLELRPLSRPASIQSQYRLRYPGSLIKWNINYIIINIIILVG
jgi:hypothetical protein